MSPGRVRRPGNAERGIIRLPGLIPGSQELADHRIQDALGRIPRNIQVVIDLPQGHRRNRRMRRRPVPPLDHQDTLGTAMQIAHTGQELHRIHSRQPLIGENKRNLRPGTGKLPQHPQCSRCRGHRDHLVVSLVTAAQIPAQRLQTRPALSNQHDSRSRHHSLPSPEPLTTPAGELAPHACTSRAGRQQPVDACSRRSNLGSEPLSTPRRRPRYRMCVHVRIDDDTGRLPERSERRQCARRHAEYRSRSVIARGGGRARHRGAGRGYQEAAAFVTAGIHQRSG